MIVLVVSFVVLLFLGIPIAYVLGISSLFYFLATDSTFLLTNIARKLFNGIDIFVLSAIPFFMFAGELMNESGLTKNIIKLVNVFVGKIRGGLAQVNVIASVLFAGLTGAAISDVSALGTILIPAMYEEGYDKPFSAAVTAGSSIVGPIIPPSIIVVIYGGMMGISVGGLFAAAIIPGLLIGIVGMIAVYYISKKRQYPISNVQFSFEKLFNNFRKSFLALLIPLIILGGILFGIVTPTEAATVSALYALLLAMFFYKSIDINQLNKVILKSVKGSAKLLYIIGVSSIFAWILAYEEIPTILTNSLVNITDNPYILLLLVSLIALFMGTWMEVTVGVIIVAPIFAPVVESLGIHPIHFAITLIISFLIGVATPPVGVCLYAAAGIADIPFESVIKDILPFILVYFIVLLGIIFFPQIVLFLPKLFGFA